ncbi:CoA transferase [Microtetraspora sp. NBRC 16547]|uniref:CoA transferase n=1 Tax=Microtetraspora sp. NBRC 16547 TaxID=3030993 RepID=UPI0025573F07|nr:CoA transferase [Microtetraspora sp. NBRC 16547]
MIWPGPVRTSTRATPVFTGCPGAGPVTHVEVNLLSTLLSSLVNQAAGYTLASRVPGIMGNRHPSIAPYEVYQAKDRPFVIRRTGGRCRRR